MQGTRPSLCAGSWQDLHCCPFLPRKYTLQHLNARPCSKKSPGRLVSRAAAGRTGVWSEAERSSSREPQKRSARRMPAGSYRPAQPEDTTRNSAEGEQAVESSKQNPRGAGRGSERSSWADRAGSPSNMEEEAQARESSPERGASSWAERPSSSFTASKNPTKQDSGRSKGEPVIPDASWASPDSPPLRPPQQARPIRSRPNDSPGTSSKGSEPRMAGRRVQRGGLWGRQSYIGSAEQPNVQASNGLDDWGNALPVPPEAEDGWGAFSASAEGRWAVHAASNDSDRQGGASSSAWAEEGAGNVGNGTTWGDRDAGPASAAYDPELVAEGGVWEEEEGEQEQDENARRDGESPDITPLAPQEADELLPVVPTAEQMGASWGDATEVFQRLGASALITLIACKLNWTLLASGSLTYFFWGPLLGATNRNRSLREKGRHVGLWRTSVLEIEVERPERRQYTRRAVEPADGMSMRVLLGDESGARSQLTMPFNRRYEQVQVGEPAELLVVSNKSQFVTFKALKEVYLPESGLWLADYPHVNRNLFLDISLDIERIRQEEMREGAFDTVA